MEKEYLLLSADEISENVYIFSKNADISSKNADNSKHSKSKVDDSKVQESNIPYVADATSAPPTSASPTAAVSPDRDSLIELFGEENVDEYEKRYDNWKAKKGGNVRGNRYETIRKMMQQDGVQKPVSHSSFDINKVQAQILRKYKKNRGENDGKA